MPRTPPYPLTEEVQRRIVSAIRHGAFPFIAAEAAGIPREVFAQWLRSGSAKRPLPHFREFRHKVREAIALARMEAETHALRHDPEYWLKYGPGRETADIPGWTNAAKPAPADDSELEQQEGEIRLGLLAALTPEMNRLPPVLREAILAALGLNVDSGKTPNP